MQKVKKSYLLAAAACILAIGGILGTLSYRDLYAKRENLLSAYEKEILPGIVCYGDSLTEGAGGRGVSYPFVLEENLRKDRMYIPVANMGIGGETSITIAGRAGGIPFRVKPFTIPEETEPAEVGLIDEGKGLNPLTHDGGVDTGINPCTIGGIEGRLFSEEGEDGVAYYFTRSESGDAADIPEGTEIKTWASEFFKDYIFVVFVGANRGWIDTEDLIRQQKAILDMQEGQAGQYIIVGLTKVSNGTVEELEELERAMQEEYGEKYINMRELLVTQGLEKAGMKPTEEDLEKMEKGEIPPSLLVDSVHFNEAGYRLIGNLIYERMKELGYFERLQRAVEEYG